MTNHNTSSTRFHKLLEEQIRNEFTAAQQYIAIAAYFDNDDLPQLAKFFYRQAGEEREHAMKMVQYFIDRDFGVQIPGVDEVRNQFGGPRDAIEGAFTWSGLSPSKSAHWQPQPATTVTISASSSCGGFSRNKSKKRPC